MLSLHFSRQQINLRCGRDGNIAFNYLIRFEAGLVGRNSYLRKWGKAESWGTFPFNKGVPFTMTILVHHERFQVFLLISLV